MLKLLIEAINTLYDLSMEDDDRWMSPIFAVFILLPMFTLYSAAIIHAFSLAGWYSLLIFPIAFFSDYIAAPLIAPSVEVLLSKAWHKVKLIEEEGKEIARMLEERIK